MSKPLADILFDLVTNDRERLLELLRKDRERLESIERKHAERIRAASPAVFAAIRARLQGREVITHDIVERIAAREWRRYLAAQPS